MNFKSLVVAAALVASPFAASAMSFDVGEVGCGFIACASIEDIRVSNGGVNNDLTSNVRGGPLDVDPSGLSVQWQGVANSFGSVRFDIFSSAGSPTFDLTFSSSTAGGGTTIERFRVEGNGRVESDVESVAGGAVNYLIDTFDFVERDDVVGTRIAIDFSQSGGTGPTEFGVTISSVPVPAGVLLMGTALAGFGVMRRKAKRAAA